ncbi:synaptonemal complex protein 4 isoform X3 [Nasonia vitripennis]|uniref:Uncharacterized protein n=1 Tax=Nasonia vitripennis TaxID=7425 RepID=A0A7M7QTG2_NASVI|nr:synaptonemal complex protein 4 isoform X3 [Nasonia vitripennis]
MRFTTTILAACLCVALVSSVPVPNEGFQSQALDRLMVVEADNDAALRSKRTIGLLRQLFPDVTKDVNPEASENNQVVSEAESQSQAESQNNEVRVQFADETPQSNNEAGEGELAPLEDVEASDDENRNKRFLNFGFGASGGNGGAGGGSGGGSGNFLFDIIRLVAGSGSSTSDPAAGAPTPGPQTEAVPGPVTRLFVIANRGISNLIQDLILRLAATSERIVNFKARLITSII